MRSSHAGLLTGDMDECQTSTVLDHMYLPGPPAGTCPRRRLFGISLDKLRALLVRRARTVEARLI